jgi:hypothetical protein
MQALETWFLSSLKFGAAGSAPKFGAAGSAPVDKLTYEMKEIKGFLFRSN